MRSVPLETIGALLGHKDPKMTKRYAHLSPTTLQQAVTTLHDLQSGSKMGTSLEAGTGNGL
jgi:site-specific recombinase XerD